MRQNNLMPNALTVHTSTGRGAGGLLVVLLFVVLLVVVWFGVICAGVWVFDGLKDRGGEPSESVGVDMSDWVSFD